MIIILLRIAVIMSSTSYRLRFHKCTGVVYEMIVQCSHTKHKWIISEFIANLYWFYCSCQFVRHSKFDPNYWHSMQQICLFTIDYGVELQAYCWWRTWARINGSRGPNRNHSSPPSPKTRYVITYNENLSSPKIVLLDYIYSIKHCSWRFRPREF